MQPLHCSCCALAAKGGVVELRFLPRTWAQLSDLVQPDLQMMKFFGEGGDSFLKLSLNHLQCLTKTSWKRHKKTANLEVQPTHGIIMPVS